MSNLAEFVPENLPSELRQVTDAEREHHRDLVVRNIDIVIDFFAAESIREQRNLPVGCPSATPEILSRKRSSGEQGNKFPCRFEQFAELPDGEGECCGDPLCGSNDPLDAVAAVCLATNGRPPSARYREHRWRELVSGLRTDVGDWDEIAALRKAELLNVLGSLCGESGFNRERGIRLFSLLQQIDDSERTAGVSLTDLPKLQYEHLADFLSGLPGISESDAWWLLLTAFEKRVWPTSPRTDILLCSLGILPLEKYSRGESRRKLVEETFSDRRLPVLHRVLSAHAIRAGGESCGSACPVRKFLLPYRIRKQNEPNDSSLPVVVDLFSGAGGFSTGMKAAGFDVRYAVDQSVHATDTYRLNHSEIPHQAVRTEDIQETVDSGFFENTEEDIDVVVGGPPCQALSLAGYRSRLSNEEEYSVLDDPRATLYQSYIDVVDDIGPEVIVIENVEGMVYEIEDTGIEVAELVLKGLAEIGYEATVNLVDCSDYGLPQDRNRVIIFGVREDSESLTLDPEDVLEEFITGRTDSTPTIRQALSGLPRLKRGEGGNVVPRQIPGPKSEFFQNADLEGDVGFVYNHQAREHPKPKDRKLFDEVMEPGMDSADVIHGSEHGDLIDYDIGTEDNPRFTDKYRMLEWDEPCPTIVAHLRKDANSFILPDYHEYYTQSIKDPCNKRNRGITPREAARIQSFPDDFVFLGSFTDWYEQIGNAVPPYIAEQIGRAIAQKLTTEKSASTTAQNSQAPAESDD
ncbi:DNA cytosine methyltransferase [Halomicrococcus sp. SG-WS-1]|uniref:DNA cytosine methyltransferase n=1 Tax=Halomicrococcus sp. SG-WS-1 TaxID=3439057 RepID=UPI003F7AD643